MDIFERISARLHKKRILLWRAIKDGMVIAKKAFRRLLFPIYLFPLKLLTYSVYYLIKYLLRLILAILRLIIRIIRYPFRKWSNLFRSIFYLFVAVYFLLTLIVISDYMQTNYGNWDKFFCYQGANTNGKVVRILGDYSQGTGFFITSNEILTNFHVIEFESAPKIILPDGHIVTAFEVVGDQQADIALLTIEELHPELIIPTDWNSKLYDNEILYSYGYPWGTELKGDETMSKGHFLGFRQMPGSSVNYIQTDSNLVGGMSGGPLIEACGSVVGINTMGDNGMSLFISMNSVFALRPNFTDKGVSKIELTDAKTPVDAVVIFYTYLKGRLWKPGFDMLSQKYLEKTNYEEWTNRFQNILSVDIVGAEAVEGQPNTVFVKFQTATWANEEIVVNSYEGTWETVLEGDVYKMNKSKIKEVIEPGYEWFYDLEEESNQQRLF